MFFKENGKIEMHKENGKHMGKRMTLNILFSKQNV
jgi:hypothetical protein